MRPRHVKGRDHSERGGEPGRRGHQRGGGRRRMFEGGELRLVLLHLIAEEPRHGYDLLREFERLTRGSYVPSPGVVYPTLTLLTEMGLLEQQDAEGQRKLFSATPGGRAFLEQNAGLVKQLLQRLEAAAEVRERTDAGPVRRAVNNLRSVLVNKFSGGADAKTALEVAALIDEAAQKIERLGS